MTKMPVPSWWEDIERSRNDALSDFESVLNTVETALSVSGDKSPGTVRNNTARWSALLNAVASISDRMTSGAGLAESRRKDVMAMGFSPPENPDMARRAAEASTKALSLSSELRRKMLLIKNELSGRRPRRPPMRLYRDNSPSHIDVRV